MNEVTENTWAGRFRASVLFFFSFLQEEGGGRAALTASLCVTALRSLSSLSHIPLCFRRACTLTMHVCSHQLDLLFCFFVVVELHSYTHIQGTWQATETAQGPSRRHGGGVPSHSLSVPPQQYAFRRHRWHSAHYRLYMSSYVILANECIIFLSAPHIWWSHQCPQSTCDLNEHKYMYCIVSTSSGNYMHAQP